MAETIAIVMMAVAFVLLIIAFVRLFPDLVAEHRTDAREIRAAKARSESGHRETR